MSRKNSTSRASVSVTARWRMRLSEVEILEGTIQQWLLQKDKSEMPELKCLAQVECGLECSTCLCKAFARLKENCQSLLDNKKMYAEAIEKLHVAQMKLAESKDRLNEHEPPTNSQHVGMTLEELVASRNETVAACNETVAARNETVTVRNEIVAACNETVAAHHKIVALSNDAVASCSKNVANAASMMLMDVRLISKQHNMVKFLLGAFKDC